MPLSYNEGLLTFSCTSKYKVGKTVKVRLTLVCKGTLETPTVSVALLTVEPTEDGTYLCSGALQVPDRKMPALLMLFAYSGLEGADRRATRRVPATVRILSRDLVNFRAVTTNVNMTGLELQCDGPVAEGAYLNLQLDLDIVGRLDFSVQVVCIWCEGETDETRKMKYRVGAAFTQQHAETLEVWSQFYRHLRSQEGASVMLKTMSGGTTIPDVPMGASEPNAYKTRQMPAVQSPPPPPPSQGRGMRERESGGFAAPPQPGFESGQYQVPQNIQEQFGSGQYQVPPNVRDYDSGGFPSPAPQTQGGFGTPPPAPGFAPAQSGGYSSPPAAQQGGYGPPAGEPAGYGAPNPSQAGGYGAPNPAPYGGYGAPPGPPGGYGSPPPAQQAGYGAPPMPPPPQGGGGYGFPPSQPAQHGGYGSPPPAQTGAYGTPPPPPSLGLSPPGGFPPVPTQAAPQQQQVGFGFPPAQQMPPPQQVGFGFPPSPEPAQPGSFSFPQPSAPPAPSAPPVPQVPAPPPGFAFAPPQMQQPLGFEFAPVPATPQAPPPEAPGPSSSPLERVEPLGISGPNLTFRCRYQPARVKGERRVVQLDINLEGRVQSVEIAVGVSRIDPRPDGSCVCWAVVLEDEQKIQVLNRLLA